MDATSASQRLLTWVGVQLLEKALLPEMVEVTVGVTADDLERRLRISWVIGWIGAWMAD